MEMFHKKTIDSIECQFHQIPMRKKAMLDPKIADIMGPIMVELMKQSMDAEADVAFMGKMVDKLGACLNKLPEVDYQMLTDELMSSVIATAPGKAPLQLTPQNIDNALAGYGMSTYYRILFEVIQFNKFLPFDLAGLASSIGSVIPQTNG